MKQKVHIGEGSIKYLKDILNSYSPKNIMLLTGKKSYLENGIKNKIENYLSGYKYVHFYDFLNNPQYADVIKGTLIFKESKCDLIIAIGGGSVIDMAKCINSFQSSNEIDYIKFVKNNLVINKGVPLVAIPTTSGTGSEATQFSVVYINKTKYSLSSKEILPDYAIIDPSFCLFQSKYQIASSGMDAFCQAIESYWAVNSTSVSKEYAIKSMIICKNNIVNAVNKNKEAICNMSLAAYYAGKAINISKTTAPHAVSYPITSYLGLAHGHAVALTLAHFMKFNYNVTDKDNNDARGLRYVKNTIEEILKVLKLKNIDDIFPYFNNLLSDLGLINDEVRKRINDSSNIIIENGFNLDRIQNNPRLLTKRDLAFMLSNI